MTTIASKDVSNFVHEDLDHLVWTGSVANGHPAMRLNGAYIMVRRAVWQEQNGPIPTGQIIRCTCGDKRCVAIEHLELTTYKKLALVLGSAVMAGPVRSAAIARVKRASKQAKLTEDAVRDIRSSNETSVALAKRYGVAQAHVSKVRLGQAWRDFSNPFQGLGARV